MGEGHVIRLDAHDRARALARVPLFAGCDEHQLMEIAQCAHLLKFDVGSTIVTEGESGRGFYLVLSGAVQVVREGQTTPVAAFGPGEFFGEVALLEGIPRTASVVATEPTICLGILRLDFRPLLVRQPRIALRIVEAEGKRFSPEVNDDAL